MPSSFESITVSEALTAIGAKQPTPGGGAVASLTAALAGAMGQMVVNYSRGRKSLLEHDALHEEALAMLAQLSERALRLADEDAEAYGDLNRLWKLAEDDPERKEQWTSAVQAAIAAPHGVLAAALEMLELMQRLVGTTNRTLRSDLAIAAILADAAARAAAWNVRINLPELGDQSDAERIQTQTDEMLSRARGLARRIEDGCT